MSRETVCCQLSAVSYLLSGFTFGRQRILWTQLDRVLCFVGRRTELHLTVISELSLMPTLLLLIRSYKTIVYFSRMKSIFTFTFFLKVIVAAILLQTLFFKFTGAPESVYIFTTVGMEPWGRYGSGVVELFASILILIPRTSWLGAGLALGTICGALFFHLTALGIEVMGDGGFLFSLACVVFVSSLFILWKERKNIPFVGKGL